MCTIGRFTASALTLVLAVAAATGSALAQTSSAQTWPQRTVRLIVPLPPGSGTDIAARLLAERLAQRWAQPVIVENRQGADGITAVTTFLAARDTHQLLFSFAGIITINPLVYERLPYDAATDLVPIAPVVDNYFGVSASSSLKAQSLADFVKLAKAQPGKLNWAASPGVPYYVVLALQKNAGVDMVQVPYREFGPAIQDLTQGRIQVAATAMQLLTPHHVAGTAKLLFVTNRQRSPQTPEVPTASEAGYPDLTFEGTVGIYGWRDIPADIQARVSSDVQTITADTDFRARIAASGSAARTGTGKDFAAAIEEQRAKIALLHQSAAKPPQ
jgi:tripartite-type tricarboxylate transporter receptor subunit TctC